MRTLRHLTADDVMTEAEFQRWVIELAEMYHWHVIHHPGSKLTVGAGFPDLVLLKADPERVIFAELKKTGGRISPSQRWVLDRLEAAGNPVYVWYPADRAEIESILKEAAA